MSVKAARNVSVKGIEAPAPGTAAKKGDDGETFGDAGEYGVHRKPGRPADEDHGEDWASVEAGAERQGNGENPMISTSSGTRVTTPS